MMKQRGQTLIETMVALFIMVMGITAALGLANYSLSAASNISNQVVAIGLAREAIEVVKNMRDTNWLIDTLSTNCYNYGDNGSATATCYKNWQNAAGGNDFSVRPGALPDPVTGYPYEFYYINADPNSSRFWSISYFDPTNCNLKYAMDYDAGTKNGVFYNPVPCENPGSSVFHRQVSIQKAAVSPFDQDVGPQLVVYARVWWRGKNCPVSQTFSGALPGCKVVLSMYLNNWKTY